MYGDGYWSLYLVDYASPLLSFAIVVSLNGHVQAYTENIVFKHCCHMASKYGGDTFAFGEVRSQ